MDNKIKAQIEYLCKLFGMELTTIKPQVNRLVSMRIKSQKVFEPNNDFYESFGKLDCVHTITHNGFQIGMKEDMCGWYVLIISITDEYFNGELDTSKINGRIIKFIADNNIKNAKDLFESTFSILKDMQLFTITTSDRKAKRKIWDVKVYYIEFLYRRGFVEETVRQTSHYNEQLTRFTINGEQHWLRTKDAMFVPMDKAPRINETYTKQHKRDSTIEIITKGKDIKESDFDFYVDLFRQLNNIPLLNCAGMNLTEY